MWHHLKQLFFCLALSFTMPSFAALSFLHDGASWACEKLQQVETSDIDDAMAKERIVVFKESVSNDNGDVAKLGGIIIRKSVRVLNWVHGLLPSGLWFWFRDVLSAIIIIGAGVVLIIGITFCLFATGGKETPCALLGWCCVIPGIIPVVAHFWKIAPVVDDILLVIGSLLLLLPLYFVGLNIYQKGSILSSLLMIVFTPVALVAGMVAAGVGAYLFWYAVLGVIILIGLCMMGGKAHQKGDRAVLDDGTRIEYDGIGEWRDRDNSSRVFEETSSGSFQEK